MAAGIPIQIDVVEQVGTTGWSARVGCHSDDLMVSIRSRFFVSITSATIIIN